MPYFVGNGARRRATMKPFAALRLSLTRGLLAAVILSGCDSNPTAPNFNYVQVHFAIEIDGNASAFGADGYVAVIDGSQTVPLLYAGQRDSLALLPGAHTVELRRTGLATDLAKPAACTSTLGNTLTFIVNTAASNTLNFRFSCEVQKVPDCPAVFCPTPPHGPTPPYTVTLRVTILATGAHAPETVRLILLQGIVASHEDVYVVKTNQTAEFILEVNLLLIGIDSPECPLPGGTFSALPYGIYLNSDTDVSISLICP